MSWIKFIKGSIDVFLGILLIVYSGFAYWVHRLFQGIGAFGGSYQSTYESFENTMFYIVLLLPIAYLSLLFLVSLSIIKVNKIRSFMVLAIQSMFEVVLLVTYFYALSISKYSSDKAMLFISGFFILFTVLFWGALGIIKFLNNSGARDMWSKLIWIEEKEVE